ncbi:MAG TPA: hypothetical protein VEJ21_00705, partial [Acidimicrobiales bacterium]|nr:hypothetical protein [Acidimicrobiales bacterium]
AFDDHAAAVVVVRDSAGGPQLESLLARALGPASLSERSGALWLSPGYGAYRAYRARHAGRLSVSVCRPVSAGGGGSGCAARDGGG